MTGNVSIDANGDRSADYVLLMLRTFRNSEGEEESSSDMVPVAGYLGKTNSFGLDQTSEIYWPRRGVGLPPPDTPECGFDGALCDKRQ